MFPERGANMLDMVLPLCRPWYLHIEYHRLYHLSLSHSAGNAEVDVEGCGEGPGRSQVPCTDERTELRAYWERDAADYRGTESGQRHPSVQCFWSKNFP